MKSRKLLSCLLAVAMLLSVMTFTALAVEAPNPETLDAPIISDIEIKEHEEGGYSIYFNLKHTDAFKEAIAFHNTQVGAYPVLFWINGLTAEMSIDNGEWRSCSITNGADMDEGERLTLHYDEIKVDSALKFRVQYYGFDLNGEWYSEWSNVLTLNEKIDIQASDWAKAELARADELGLIPETLEGSDLTADITRAEFAAVAVKVYENLSGTAAIPAVINPFTDTKDVEILKAYNIGAVDFTEEQARKQIIEELFEKDYNGQFFISKIGINAGYSGGFAAMIEDKEWAESYKQYNVMLERKLRMNFRLGYWEIAFYHTKPLSCVPKDMRMC